MTRYEKLMERIDNGEFILIDGATGTEMERRGVPKLEHAWNGGGAISDPEILHSVHSDYIQAGADIIITNTFATLKSALQDARCGEQFERYNRRAVEIANDARETAGKDDVVIAGSISHWSWSSRNVPIKELCANASEQAIIMKLAGVDIIMLEMMSEIGSMTAVLDGAEKSGLPIWVGLSCVLDSRGTPTLLSGESIEEAIEVVTRRNVGAVNIMHTDVDCIDVCLDVVMKLWAKPIGVYAHSGDYIGGDWVFSTVINVIDYVEVAKRWKSRGVQIIGGCCGIGPRHIQAIHELCHVR
ncbi:MAG: homocysteine methyltransferase [Acidiferrobacteraceae bacterium]|nr:homocysteine methyltransferase [Acidiferrobacteraceae bacterium]